MNDDKFFGSFYALLQLILIICMFPHVIRPEQRIPRTNSIHVKKVVAWNLLLILPPPVKKLVANVLHNPGRKFFLGISIKSGYACGTKS